MGVSRCWKRSVVRCLFASRAALSSAAVGTRKGGILAIFVGRPEAVVAVETVGEWTTGTGSGVSALFILLFAFRRGYRPTARRETGGAGARAQQRAPPI